MAFQAINYIHSERCGMQRAIELTTEPSIRVLHIKVLVSCFTSKLFESRRTLMALDQTSIDYIKPELSAFNNCNKIFRNLRNSLLLEKADTENVHRPNA